MAKTELYIDVPLDTRIDSLDFGKSASRWLSMRRSSAIHPHAMRSIRRWTRK